MPKKKKSLGRNPFEDANVERESATVAKLIKGRPHGEPGAKEVAISVKLTPSNLKHLENLRTQLATRGKRQIGNDELIRIAITLLSVDDIH